ncbi:holin [Massilia varians]|uniref:holin n=1 Tax=Massilia varians TaxID=457921 RepID=UPI002554D338|nr:holin [Massilia varians]MDK6075565.1 holin [Massilia varians]
MPAVGSYLGGAASVGASLTLADIGVITGILTALLTFALNLWQTYRRNEREKVLADLERREREARLAQIGVGK